jgi:guanylate kinase
MKSFAVAICAPSGAGKTTVAQTLVGDGGECVFSVSATTREPREGEREGIDYRFVSREEFERLIKEDALLEWAEVHGDLYGTPRANLEQAERDGKLLILDIDVQGARQVRQARPDTVGIFLLPPSFDVLMERLRNRGSEDAGRVQLRMDTAKAELERVAEFEYVVINDRLEDAVSRVQAIIDAERQRLSRRGAEVEGLRVTLLQDLDLESP